MKTRLFAIVAPFLLASCAADDYYDPLQDYEAIDATTILDAPTLTGIAAENQALVNRGEYLVELLGCGSCHTDGALIGEPDMSKSLAGSRIGIAYTNPLENKYPGIVFPPNLTPDRDTGIERWTDNEIADAVRVGIGTHGARRILVMPWQGYAKLSDEDTWAIVAYLRNMNPVRHVVPDNVAEGTSTNRPFVHFGVYRSRSLPKM